MVLSNDVAIDNLSDLKKLLVKERCILIINCKEKEKYIEISKGCRINREELNGDRALKKSNTKEGIWSLMDKNSPVFFNQ